MPPPQPVAAPPPPVVRRPPPVPISAANAPVPPPAQKGSKTGLIIAGVVVVALGVGAFVFFQQRNRAPSTSLIHDQVRQLVATPPLQLTQVTSTVTPTTSGHATVEYQAEAQLAEALYEPADAVAILRDDLKLDVDAWQKTRRTLSGKSAPRILELAGLKDTDGALLQGTFLRTATPAGTKYTFTGSFRADRGDHGWQLQSERLTRNSGEPRGQPRKAFAGPTVIIDDPAELKKLQGLAAAQAALPAKVEDGRQAFLKERQAQQEKIIADLLETLQPGTVYAGTVAPASGTPAKVFLEFTSLNAKSRQLAATLRNDGGWTDQRPFTGTFTFDPDTETLSVTLDTAAKAAIRDGGPVLSDNEGWRQIFQLNGSALTARDNRRSFALTRLSAEETAKARNEVDAEGAALREATRAGLIYRGTVRSHDGSHSAEYLLRFRQQDADAGVIAAVLEPTAHEGWRRVFRGTVIASRYRAQGTPIRLDSRAGESVKLAEKTSPVGFNRDLPASLKLVNGHLQGDAQDFSFDLAPLSAAEIARIEAAEAERAKSLLALVKAGTGFPGSARLDSKSYNEKVRLRFRKVEDQGASIDAVLESLERPGIFREFTGALNPAEKRIVLTATGKDRARAASRAGIRLPLLARASGDHVLSLELTSDGFAGENQSWKLSFPAAGAVALTGDGTGDFPGESGAYVWSGTAWLPLPRNDGKLVSKAPTGSQVVSGFMNMLTKQSAAAAANDRAAEIVFSGTDPAPTVDGREVIVICVGLPGEPALGLTNRDANGSRRIAFSRSANGSASGALTERMMTAVDHINESVTELATTRALRSGSYAVVINGEFFELNVE